MKKLLIAALAWGSLFGTASAGEEVNVYSARIEKLIKPAFTEFTKETGIKVNYTTAKANALLERLKAEGKHTKVDLLITVDAGNLWQAANENLLQPVSSNILNKNIPEEFKDPKDRWYGLTLRARTIVYSADRVNPADLSTYEALGDKKWKDRLCLRTSKSVYNKSLIATMIETEGEAKTKEIVQGWMDNNPRITPKDSILLKTIAQGKCDVGIVNTYYLGRVLKKDANFPVKLLWANQNENGVHVNVSGAGVTRYAKHKANAIKLLEFLSSKKAQNLFADKNMEHPVNPGVSPSKNLVKWWGDDFKKDDVNLSSAGKNQKKAVILTNKLRYK